MLRKQEEQERLLREIVDILLESQDGGQFRGFGHDMAAALLYAAYLPQRRHSEFERRYIANHAPFEAAKGGKITVATLRRAIDQVNARLAKNTAERYVFQTGLLVPSSLHFSSFTLNGVRIKKEGQWGYWTTASEAVKRLIQWHVPYSLPNVGLPVTVSMRGPDAQSAAEASFYALDVLRGCWNLCLNGLPIHRDGARKPYSAVRRAPVTLLVESPLPDEREQIWYEEYVAPPESARITSEQWTRAIALQTRIYGLIRRSSFCTELEDALYRYAVALDSHDPHICFTRLWGLLEFITASITDTGTMTIKRAASVFKDGARVGVTLSAMRLYRNRYVHGGHEGLEVDALLWQLDSIVRGVLRWVIAVAPRFPSLAEVAEFMSLPRDPDLIRRYRRLYALADRFVSAGTLERNPRKRSATI